MWAKLLLFLIFFLFSCTSLQKDIPSQKKVSSENLKIELQIFYEKTEITLSELWKVKLVFRYPSFYQFKEKYLNFLDYQPLLLFTTPIEQKILHNKEELWEHSFSYIFEAPTIGNFAVQKKTFVFKDLETEQEIFLAMPMIILNVLTSITKDSRFQRINQPIAKDSYTIYYILGGAFFLLLIGIYFFYRKKKETTHTIAITKWALDELKKINPHQLVTTIEIKNFHLELSKILRIFFEKQFSTKALTKTKEEFIKEVSQNKKFAENYQQLLKHYLEMNDLVKFAKYRTTQQHNIEILELVKKIITFYHKQK